MHIPSIMSSGESSLGQPQSEFSSVSTAGHERINLQREDKEKKRTVRGHQTITSASTNFRYQPDGSGPLTLALTMDQHQEKQNVEKNDQHNQKSFQPDASNKSRQTKKKTFRELKPLTLPRLSDSHSHVQHCSRNRKLLQWQAVGCCHSMPTASVTEQSWTKSCAESAEQAVVS